MHNNPFPEVIGFKFVAYTFESRNFLRRGRCMMSGNGHGCATGSAIQGIEFVMPGILRYLRCTWKMRIKTKKP